ncbi:MAG: hypothetical protein IJ846_08190 [Alphaproteobacteria bacterium]|nr:hypothetical protein [Alphaproteobacteria bacterium]
MQDNSACFEGWAIGLKAWDENKKIDKIYLDVDGDLPEFNKEFKEKDKKIKLSGHYGRFLYRALRFSEQYSWFLLSENVRYAVNNFEDFLTDKKGKLLNNCPSKSQAKTSPSHIESIVEEMLANKKNVFYKAVGQSLETNVFRQLPVGLFEEIKQKGKEVFPSNKAAVDLWTIDGDIVRIVELKAANPMVGVITEIFFYTNFISDLLNGIFAFNKENGNKSRGYNELKNSKGKKVQGVMLADSFASLITKKVVNVLNDNGRKDLDYIKASYDFDIKIPS